MCRARGDAWVANSACHRDCGRAADGVVGPFATGDQRGGRRPGERDPGDEGECECESVARMMAPCVAGPTGSSPSPVAAWSHGAYAAAWRSLSSGRLRVRSGTEEVVLDRPKERTVISALAIARRFGGRAPTS